MTERSPYSEGTPSWVDLSTSDREAAMRFYGGVLGWEFEVGGPETGYYTQAMLRGLPVAGLMEPPPAEAGAPQMPVAWTTYLASEDVDATCRKVQDAGGAVLMPPMEVMEFGRMAIVADPTGAVFGLWQAGKHGGAGIVGEPGAMTWHEAMTHDSKAAREFYTAVFGYQLEDLPEPDLDYSVLKLGQETVGGIWGMTEDVPPEIPSYWQIYFAVDDADLACRRVTDGGGRVLRPPMDTEYGRWGVVEDPQGAVFAVIKLPEAEG